MAGGVWDQEHNAEFLKSEENEHISEMANMLQIAVF